MGKYLKFPFLFAPDLSAVLRLHRDHIRLPGDDVIWSAFTYGNNGSDQLAAAGLFTLNDHVMQRNKLLVFEILISKRHLI